MEDGVVSMGPWIGVLSQIIGWTFFLIALAVLKSFFTRGISIVIGEFLIKLIDEEQRERLVRWFGNGTKILEYLKYIDEKMANEKKKSK